MEKLLPGKAVLIGVFALIFLACGMAVGTLIVFTMLKTEPERKVQMEASQSDGSVYVTKTDETAVQEPKTGALVLDTRASGEPAEETSLAALLSDRQVYFAGIDDVTISRQSVIYLENLPENDDILMQYEIVNKDTGETLETTGLIPAGERIAWIPGEMLADGSYTLVFKEKPFYEYQGGYFALTQGNNEVSITIVSQGGEL